MTLDVIQLFLGVLIYLGNEAPEGYDIEGNPRHFPREDIS
jgi:hypothetical protein